MNDDTSYDENDRAGASDADDGGPVKVGDPLTQLGQRLLELSTHTTALDSKVDALTTTVDDLSAGLDHVFSVVADPARPAVFRWEHLEPDEAIGKWAIFTAWVHDIDRWFRYNTVPGCPQWWRHKGLVEELTALWIEWLAAWAPDAKPTDARQFHEALARAEQRCKRLVPSCSRSEHHRKEISVIELPPAPEFSEAAVHLIERCEPYTTDYLSALSNQQ